MTWYYEEKEIDIENDLVHKNIGFVYRIINLNSGKLYIGKKLFWARKKYKPLKGKVRPRIVERKTDWENYWSSCQPLVEDIKKMGEKSFKREIISFHENKTEVNYAELCELVINNVLDARDSKGEKLYYNENIERIYYPSENYNEYRCELHQKRLDNYNKVI